MGTFLHATEGEMVCESINTKIPYFNAPIYLENKVRQCDRLHCDLADGSRQQ
jgi:H/ACA ribonucleoprotein complex subunit 1